MPLYPIEKAEKAPEGDHYAEIQTVVLVKFTQELDAEAIDTLERNIDTQIGMMVSFMLGQMKERIGTEGEMGMCDISTRALMPGEAIANYYRQIADEIEATEDDDTDTEDIVQQVREAMEEWSKKPVQESKSDPKPVEHKPYQYPCGLQVGDCVDFGENRSNSLPRTALVAEWQEPRQPHEYHINIATVNGPSLVHTSHIRCAYRKGVELQKTNDGRTIRFSEPKPAGSDTQ